MWSVFFVFLSYLDRNFVKGDLPSHTGKGSKEMVSAFNGALCAKVSTVGENLLYRVSDRVEVVHSVVSADGEVVDCSVTVNQMQVRSFMRECRLGPREQRGGRQVDTRFTHMDRAKQMCREFKERSERSGRVERKDSEDAALQDKVLQRSKRGLTYPGTLWCGAGNMADHYDQLGAFAETDSCCRIHDHCPHVIHAFSSNYGYTNFKWHSICHCDCDNKLKACLRKVNDTSSRVVGQAFFNVIGVPCFEFVYEERCAERHWYGVCKRYEKLPVAVIKEAVPYDFGGIDVIDELPLSSPKKTDSKKEEEDVPETTTQSKMSGPEEPSLRNVVTAAEDFIKVLATVSTSQSSTTDSDKGEMQSSEKKRKSTAKKKKTAKKRKGKGKGGKGKQKAEAGVKTEEGTTVSTSGSKAEDVRVLSNFLSESRTHEQSSGNANRVGDGGYEPRGKDESSNEVMKDEPAMEKETVSITSPATVEKKPESTEEITLYRSIMRTNVPQRAKTRRLREGGRKRSKTISLSSSEEFAMGPVDNYVPTVITPTPAAQPQQQSFVGDSEQPVVSSARIAAVSPKDERRRSKERGDGQGRKKRRKDGLASPIVATPDKNSSVGHVRVIPLTASPTVSSVPTTGQKVSPRLDIYIGKRTVQDMPLNPSFSGLRSMRGKTVLPLSSEDPLFQSSSENVFTVLPTPETGDALVRPATAAVISRPIEETETRGEGQIFTTITMASPSITKRHRQTISRRRKPRKKASPAVLGDGVSILAEQTPMTFTTKPSKTATTDVLNLQGYVKTTVTTSTTPVMSPIQLSIERVNAQFSRKKRRKAALSVRQQ